MQLKQYLIVGITLIVLFIAMLTGYYWLTMRNQETSPANNEDLIDLFNEIPNQNDADTNYTPAPYQPPQETSNNTSQPNNNVEDDQESLPWLDGPSDSDATTPPPGSGSGSGSEPWNQGPSD